MPLAVSTLPLPLSSTMPNRVNSFSFWGEILITRWFFLPLGFIADVVAGWGVMSAPLDVENSGLPPDVPGSAACFLPALFFCADPTRTFLCCTSVVTFCTTGDDDGLTTGRGFVGG